MTYHIHPVNDLEKHDLFGNTCKCHPAIDLIEGGILVIHNSFDGREAVEMAKEILKNSSHTDSQSEETE